MRLIESSMILISMNSIYLISMNFLKC